MWFQSVDSDHEEPMEMEEGEADERSRFVAKKKKILKKKKNLPIQHQVITRPYAVVLSIGPLGVKFSET